VHFSLPQGYWLLWTLNHCIILYIITFISVQKNIVAYVFSPRNRQLFFFLQMFSFCSSKLPGGWYCNDLIGSSCWVFETKLFIQTNNHIRAKGGAHATVAGVRLSFLAVNRSVSCAKCWKYLHKILLETLHDEKLTKKIVQCTVSEQHFWNTKCMFLLSGRLEIWRPFEYAALMQWNRGWRIGDEQTNKQTWLLCFLI
jgi:hypothetical protein